jgi:spore coat protein H
MHRPVPVGLSAEFLFRSVSMCVLLLLAVRLDAADVHARTADELFGQSPIRRFKIDVPEPDLQKLQRNNRAYIHATVTVGEQVYKDVGIRLKGQGSFLPVQQKPSLAIKFNEFVAGQKFHGLTKILLNNASQDTTLLSEYLATSLFRDADVPAARVTHARVVLNGRDLGFYVLAEAMNKVFVKENFDDADGNLYEGYARDIDQKLEQDVGTPSDQSALRELVATAKLPSSERMPRLRQILDVDRFYSFLAISTVIAQHDSYQYNRNNYRLYHDPKSKRFVMIPHGIDGSFKETSLSIRPPAKYILTRALLETEEGQKQYRKVLHSVVTNVFKIDVITNRVQLATERLLAAAETAQERTRISALSASFLQRVAERFESVTRQVAQSDPPRLTLAANETALLTGWESFADSGRAEFEERMVDGRKVLCVKTDASTAIGAWRTRAILQPGRYRFSGEVQTVFRRAEGQAPSTPRQDSASTVGAGLRTYKMYATVRRTVANGAWKPLEHPFVVVAGDQEVEFVCDFRGADGEAWFARDSLKLKRDP